MRLRHVFAGVSVSIASALFAQDLSMPGPFAAGFRQVTITRANSTTFTARLHYPALAAGQNTALNSAGAPYPAVSFGHGFFQAVSTYQSTLAHLATHGFLVIATDSEGSLAPSHQNFANDILHCLTYLEQEHASPGSFLFGAVDTGRYGLSGHSMGGGASILAAAADARIDAVAVLAAAETNPSALAALPNVRVPIRLIAGSQDTIVTVPATNTPMYNAANTPKQAPVILGGFHCGFQDSSFPFGCDSGNLPRAEQLAVTRRLLTEWFLLYLKGTQTPWRSVWGPDLGADARVQTASASGFGLSPGSQTSTAVMGRTAETAWMLSNQSSVSQSYDVLAERLVEGGVLWPSVGEPGVTELISPGGSRHVLIRTTAPLAASTGSNTLLITARSRRDGGTRAYATLAVTSTCPADMDDGSGLGVPDGGVSIDDLLYYLRIFSDGLPASDTDDGNGSGMPDGGVTIEDLLFYLERFDAGC